MRNAPRSLISWYCCFTEPVSFGTLPSEDERGRNFITSYDAFCGRLPFFPFFAGRKWRNRYVDTRENVADDGSHLASDTGSVFARTLYHPRQYHLFSNYSDFHRFTFISTKWLISPIKITLSFSECAQGNRFRRLLARAALLI